MAERATAAEITRRLESFGCQTQQIGGGVVGVLENGAGPTVLFRADIDALPVQEETGLTYSSEVPGVMHACGHDFHITSGLGAAALLAENRNEWSGTYIALFQPGEETAEGARAMVDDGLVDKVPRPDVALSQHVLTKPAAGEVATALGPVLSTAASMKVVVCGKGSHGSMPHLGIDPVVLASAIVMRLQGIVSREIAPSEFGVVTVGSLQAGSKANIIPDRAELLINIRAYDAEIRDQLISSIERIARAECEASGAPRAPEIEVFERYPLTDNDPAVTERVTAAFVEHFGSDRVKVLDPITASEDFSVIPDAFGIPYTYWGAGGFLPDQDVRPESRVGEPDRPRARSPRHRVLLLLRAVGATAVQPVHRPRLVPEHDVHRRHRLQLPAQLHDRDPHRQPAAAAAGGSEGRRQRLQRLGRRGAQHRLRRLHHLVHPRRREAPTALRAPQTDDLGLSDRGRLDPAADADRVAGRPVRGVRHHRLLPVRSGPGLLRNALDRRRPRQPPRREGGLGVRHLQDGFVLGSAMGAAVSLAVFTAMAGSESSIIGNVVEFQGRTDNVGMRQAAMVALGVNLIFVILAILSIALTVPKGGGSRDLGETAKTAAPPPQLPPDEARAAILERLAAMPLDDLERIEKQAALQELSTLDAEVLERLVERHRE